jgi:hypothetical protein
LSGRPAAEPPVDLLRPRNIYAVVLVTVAVFLTASAAGWSPRSSTPPGAVPTGGVSASTSSPTASSTPAPTTLTVSPPATGAPVALSTPTPSPTPAPTPTISQLAAAYVDAATTFDKANRGALAAWASSARTFMDAKRRAKAYAAAELAFVRAVQRIPWYGDYKTLARRVLTIDNLRYVSLRSAMTSTSWTDYNMNWNKADAVTTSGSATSNELRIALDLPPVSQPDR